MAKSGAQKNFAGVIPQFFRLYSLDNDSCEVPAWFATFKVLGAPIPLGRLKLI
jgi:hypothetical protein